MTTSPPVKHTPKPTSNAKLAQRLNDLESRVSDLESVINAAKLHRQREAAAKLAAHPEQLAQLQSLIELAKEEAQKK